MRTYVKFDPRFWLDTVAKKLKGHPEAQLVALYLYSSPHSSMIGLYRLPAAYAVSDLGISGEAFEKALAQLEAANFCSYDREAEIVWVHAMALSQIGERIHPSDKQLAGVRNLLAQLPSVPLKVQFIWRYASDFYLQDLLDGGGEVKAPSEPLESQDQKQDQKQKQKQIRKRRRDLLVEFKARSSAHALSGTQQSVRRSFAIPSPDQVSAYMTSYAAERNLTVDPVADAQKFHDHYSSNGWLVSGKTPMADWQAAARNWLNRSKEASERSNRSNRRHPSAYDPIIEAQRILAAGRPDGSGE